MRLSEEQIQAGFMHPSRVVRGTVASYFADRFNRDPEVTRSAIRGVEQYGWQDFLTWAHKFCELPLLDDDSFEWVCQQVQRTDSEAPSANQRWHLRTMLTKADAMVLARQQSRLLAMDILEAKGRETIVRRIELTQADPEECWQTLEAHCLRAATAESFAEAKISEAKLLLEPLLRDGDRFVPRILEILRRPLPDPDVKDADHWLIGLMIILAGHLRLEEAAPLIWDHWEADWDWYNEEVMYSLTRIGTPSVVQLARERFLQSEWYVRNYAHNLLENIRSDESVDAIEELLAGEEDNFLRGQLGVAAAAQFDDRAANLALQLWNENPEDPERETIREILVAFSHLSGWELSERDQWEADVNENDRRMQTELPGMGDFLKKIGALRNSEADLSPLRREFPNGDFIGDDALSSDDFDDNERSIPEGTIVRHRPRVGRNDHCPCGSGKKYKKCCLNETVRTT